MGLFDEIIENQEKEIARQKEEELRRRSILIPETIAEEYAQNIYSYFRTNILTYTSKMDGFKWDSGNGICNNYRYEFYIGTKNGVSIYPTTDLGVRRKEEKILGDFFPQGNEYMQLFNFFDGCDSSDYIKCLNVDSVKIVLNKAYNKLKNEGINCTLTFRDCYDGHLLFVFAVVIPCDNNGVIKK